MSFAVFADGTANLPNAMLEGITLLPCDYTRDGKPETYTGDLSSFDVHAYYESLRQGTVIQTSLLNTHLFVSYFTPVVQEGQDIIYVSMSSGISGTYYAAIAAAQEVMEQFPERYVHIVDSHGCGFGCGLLARKAADLSLAGMSAREAGAIVDAEVPHTCQYFTVDDLAFLQRTGRVSGVTAAIGTILNIKPILFGDSTGHIVACTKVRGRRKSIEMLAAKYREKKLDSPEQKICISHGDCPEDAQALAAMVREITPGVPVTICQHEPFSGAHVGPGMLALFFRGKER